MSFPRKHADFLYFSDPHPGDPELDFYGEKLPRFYSGPGWYWFDGEHSAGPFDDEWSCRDDYEHDSVVF